MFTHLVFLFNFERVIDHTLGFMDRSDVESNISTTCKAYTALRDFLTFLYGWACTIVEMEEEMQG